jgi:TPR repeat protein
MPRITISYRRDDSGVITGRIFDRLAAHFGRESVFRDIDDIPPGVDFRKHISGILDESDIVLAIVGPRWVGPARGPSRLANAADPVRIEIETALRKEVSLIPILVQRANMPRVEQLPESLADFAYRNAVQVDSGQDFDVHMARLFRAMDRILRAMGQRAAPGAAEGSGAAIVHSAPNDPEPIPDEDTPPEAAPPPSAEIEALREANRELEEKLAALTAEPEAAWSPEDVASEPEAAPATENAVEIPRAPIPAPAQDPQTARRLGRGAAFVVLGALLGIAATIGANEYLMREQPSLFSASDAGALAKAKQASDAKSKALQEELTTVRVQTDQDRKKQVEALAAAQEKTTAAEKRLNEQANNLRDAQTRADKAEKALAAEQETSAASSAQVEQLTGSITALREHYATIVAALGASEAKVKDQQAQIAELGSRLKQALAAKVPELAAQKDVNQPTTTTATPESEANWTVDEKREIQLALRALGHLPGDADGNFGPGTRAAIKQFQSFQGASETGVLSEADRQTLLGMAQLLSKLLERPVNSPAGVAATGVRGAAQRYARAWAHETGKGGRMDPAEAAYWYGLAAADGSATALTNLGTLVARGYADAQPDPAGAAILWWAAATRGEATAMFNLGAMWERGIGVAADIGRARAWYERAAARNDPGARAALKRLGA